MQIKASRSLHTFATSVVASCLSDNYIVCSGWCINNVPSVSFSSSLTCHCLSLPNHYYCCSLRFVLFCLLQFLHLLYCFVLIELTTLSCLCLGSSINSIKINVFLRNKFLAFLQSFTDITSCFKHKCGSISTASQYTITPLYFKLGYSLLIKRLCSMLVAHKSTFYF